ncbi:NACHT domain-containing protein [Streptomyces calidiresistens]|uniref:NACHT domain-containing protein n=1 Tax=Streptomyces calidiresistens TaxID=1485586 RepID=UPI001E5B808A|nr:NACHT domain-containing protein [Streptomyces calidiresistens]
MEPSSVALRLATGALAPLIGKLFVKEGPGAELVDRPVRLSSLVSFRGERRTLGEPELRRLAGELVRRSGPATGPAEAPSQETAAELADALARALHALGDLDMDDVQAVRLGPDALAARLPRPRDLSADADARWDALLHTCCVHVLHFFTTRSTFVARAQVEQTRMLHRLAATTDLLLERIGDRRAEDAAFERRWAEHVIARHGELTIHGLDIGHGHEWPLDAAYVPLEVTTPETEPGSAGPTAPAGAGGSGDSGDPSGLVLRAEDALAGRERVLLRGVAGSGKSTLVQWLAVTAARTHLGPPRDHPPGLDHLVGRVPFVLPLRRVVVDGRPPTPDRFAHAVGSPLAAAQPDGWADRVLAAGRALLLVDGVDEVPERDRGAVRRWIRELMTTYPGNPWVVTARPSAVREEWLADRDAARGFAELSLAPMSRTDIELFVTRWHEAADADPALGAALVTAVRTTDALARMAVNPLMCGLLCALHRDREGFLPTDRRDLYEAALGMLLERRDLERGVDTTVGSTGPGGGTRLSRDALVRLVQRLAHWMIRNDRAEMDRADAVGQLARVLPAMAHHLTADADTVLRHLLERCGLLREPVPGRIDFVHRTFQDYLGAGAAVEEGDFPLLLDNAHRDRWEDVIRMAVALGRPAERARLLEGLLEGTGENFPPEPPVDEAGARVVRRVLLAADCVAHASELDPGTRRRVTDTVARLLPPADLRQARFLAHHGGTLLLGLLPGPEGLTDEEAGAVVVTALKIGTDAALPPLARYRRHPSLWLRRQLAWNWHHFDAERYAREILADLDDEGLYISVHTPEHLRLLRDLGGRARVQLVGTHRPEDLATHLVPERLTHLWWRNLPAPGDDGAWTAGFPHLREIRVRRAAVAEGFGPPPGFTAAPHPEDPKAVLMTRGPGNPGEGARGEN